MKIRLSLAILIGFAAAPALGISIGLFSDDECSSCNLNIPLGSAGTFYVRLLPGGNHIEGAELRVVGLPPEWTVVSVTSNPDANLVLGNVLGEGANIAFPKPHEGDCFDLFTIQVLATTSVSDVVLRVTQHSTPSNPNRQCPVLFPGCYYKAGDPMPDCYTALCAAGGSLFVNSSRDCTVASLPATWSGMKKLYD